MSSRPLAVFFAKRPEPGQVKTRLCPPLDPVAASELCHRLHLDLFHRFGRRRPNFHLGVAYWPKGGKDYFERITPAGTEFFLQRGEDLASRIIHFFEEAFASGFGPVVILGSDVPLLQVERVEESFEALASQNDLTIGPDGGGGYYLLGLKAPAPFLFQGIEMSTQTMLEETRARAQKHGLKTSWLPIEKDLDYPEDLLRLVEAAVRRPKLCLEIPELISFIRELGYLTEVPSRG